MSISGTNEPVGTIDRPDSLRFQSEPVCLDPSCLDRGVRLVAGVCGEYVGKFSEIGKRGRICRRNTWFAGYGDGTSSRLVGRPTFLCTNRHTIASLRPRLTRATWSIGDRGYEPRLWDWRCRALLARRTSMR